MRRVPRYESGSEITGCSLFPNKAAADLSSVPASTEVCAGPHQRLRKRRRITAEKGKRQTRAGIGGPFVLASILLFLTLAIVAEGIATTGTDVHPAKSVAASLRRLKDSARVAVAVGGRGREGDRQLEGECTYSTERQSRRMANITSTTRSEPSALCAAASALPRSSYPHRSSVRCKFF